MSYMKIDEDDLATNPTPRVPICLLLDTSYSMEGEPINELNHGVKLFIDALNICGQSFGQKNIIVRDAPDVELGNDTVLCMGESINFYGTGTGNAIAWNPPGAVDDPYSLNTSATPSQSTMFKLEVSDNFCTGRDSIFVMVQDLPVADAGQDVLIEDGGYIQINASISSGDISWSPSDGLSCDDCSSPIASPAKTTTYILTVTDSVGCTSIDTIDVVVLESVVNLPMAFSPNADGVNDYLFAEGQYVAHFYLRIFNRWGNIVFETNDMQIGWDGKFGGSEQPLGTYVYVITGTLYEEPYVKQGNISLLR